MAHDPIEAALEAAVEGSPETATPGMEGSPEASATADASKESSTDPKSTHVPYDRFAEVVADKNDFKQRLSEVEAKLDARDGEIRDVQSRYEEAENLLDQIRGLAADDKYREHVLAIDRALKGLPDDEDTDEESTEDGDEAKTKEGPSKDELRKLKEETADALAEQRAEQLLQLIQQRASEYLNSLPEEYTEKDREVIARLWSNWVDWDGIEDDPGTMNQALSESLGNLLEWYEQPRGAAIEAEPTEPATPPEPSPGEKLKTLLDRDWGALGEKGDPLASDEDFQHAFAEAARLAKQSS